MVERAHVDNGPPMPSIPVFACLNRSTMPSRAYWAAVAIVLVVGIFMLIAGIGPLGLPIAVILVGIAAALLGKTVLSTRLT